MEALNISIPMPLIIKAIENLPMKDKFKLADKLEENLLSEFDEYDNSIEVKKRIELSMNEYKAGNFKTLSQLKNNEL